MLKPRPEDMRTRKSEPYAPGKDFYDWDFTFNGHAGTLDPAYPTLAESNETVADSGASYGTTRTAVCDTAVPGHDAHTEKSTQNREKVGNNGFEAHTQLRLMYGTSQSGRQHGITRSNYGVQGRYQN